MRLFITGFIAFHICIMIAYAQGSPLQALYNPSTGEVVFNDPDSRTAFPASALSLESQGGNLILSNAADLLLPLLEVSSTETVVTPAPFAGSDSMSFTWFLSGPTSIVDPALTSPGSAGRIVTPGTDASDLTFSYLLTSIPPELAMGQIFQVPEPSSVLLLLSCLVSTVMRRAELSEVDTFSDNRTDEKSLQ